VRKIPLRWYYMMITALLIAMMGCVIQSGVGGRWSEFGVRGATALEKIAGLLDSTEPVADNPDLTIRTSMIPSSNNGFIDPRQDPPPVWERVLLTKQTGIMAGFFFAIMVISLFFIFYRSSRNGSGNDDDGSQGLWRGCKYRFGY
jgi:hypothetical protein